MQKLKAIIEQHGRWEGLSVFVERIETHVEADFSIALENSKTLLETISHEICISQKIEIPASATTNDILKKAFIAIGCRGDDLVSQISRSLANIGQQMGNLRNDIGSTAHGMPLDKLRERNNKVDIFTRELLVDTTEMIASFLIRAYEALHPSPVHKPEPEQPSYESCRDFNDYWDESFGDFEMGTYSYPASEILYNLDPSAYGTEYRNFKSEAV